MPRKKRTREHQIADLSTNHVERFAILANFSTERIEHDYGFDLNIYTHSATGEIENGFFFIQLKASDSPKYLKDGQHVSFDIEKGDLEQWIPEPFPVILVLYDAQKEKAFWLYVQRYFATLPAFDLDEVNVTYTVRFNVEDVVDFNAMFIFAKFKEQVLAQVEGVIRHV